MSIWRDAITKPSFPIAALLAVGLVACATTTQPQPASTTAAAATPSAQPTAESSAKMVNKKAAHKKLASRNNHAKQVRVLASNEKAAKPAPQLDALDHKTANPRAEAKLSAGNTASVLSRLHQDDLAEIALAKSAEDKSASQEVRSYADQLISDHLAVDKTVLAMAQKTGVQLREPTVANPAKLGAANLETKVISASSKHFDKAFLLQTSSDHERLLNKLKKDREDASNDDVEALIDKVMPILQQDQQLARILMNKEQAS
jgi:putative membrane protein